MLEGMGRAIESNFDAVFSIDTIKIALIKDTMVAHVIGVELFEPVFRFEPAIRFEVTVHRISLILGTGVSPVPQ